MVRSKIVAIAAALALTSSVAVARTAMHGHWMGTIAGKDGMKITGTAMMAAPGDIKMGAMGDHKMDDGKMADHMASETKPADGAMTEVMVELKGDAAGVVRPWHVHTGSCASGGGVFGGGKSYTPITIESNGHGMSKAMLPVALPDTGSYYVNIHESAANMSHIVACGDLKHGM